ncbi:MAG: TatD family nuclease-associated radical SAM protein [Clostridia bacterium]
MIITYKVNNNIYINLTNRCSNACGFCVRNYGDFGEYNLWLPREPEAEEVIAELGNLDDIGEVVFCGYGEPIYRLDEILKISDYVHSKGKKTRLNTNGQGSLIHPEVDVPKLLEGKVDIVSISLNAATAEQYNKICRSEFGKEAFDALIEFGKECVKYIPRVIFTVVDIIGSEEIERAAKIAKDAGAEFRVRKQL